MDLAGADPCLIRGRERTIRDAESGVVGSSKRCAPRSLIATLTELLGNLQEGSEIEYCHEKRGQNTTVAPARATRGSAASIHHLSSKRFSRS